MTLPRSLQARLGLAIGGLITLLWIAAAVVTAVTLRHEMDEVFDSALQEVAQRLLPLAVMDIVEREEEGITQRLGAVAAHDEFFTFVVRDAQGRVLLQSHTADPAVFPDYDGAGFRQTPLYRLYNEDALQGSVRITVAEPLAHRRQVSQDAQLALGLPLLIVLPVTLLAIVLAVRAGLAPLRRFRERLAARHARDLSQVLADDLPLEIAPVAATLNTLLGSLDAAFAAERSFAANAAHELRTPLAGAIAHAQRLQSETADPAARARAGEIEATLKRLTRQSERLMQLARAEGGRLTVDVAHDLRPVVRIVVDDLRRSLAPGRVTVSLPEQPVMSHLDPDIVGILCRNLVENALRHGSEETVTVSIAADGQLVVTNAGPVVPPEVLAGLTDRFARRSTTAAGSGLGLAIVAAVMNRIGSALTLTSPPAGQDTGFAASVAIPVTVVGLADTSTVKSRDH
ncbi:ATP-binding protein [Loktanella sp. M215]|uniref:ATP-binding protein n=1 Tax=Loktanella sp. M215 TaxID=2675431 RepID=UPI001F43B27A|nr:ATP-binding protein [Loktanella sp. M215]MCF7701576.1 two-component sensor histidine kinase [Loktanella sp. M215]